MGCTETYLVTWGKLRMCWIRVKSVRGVLEIGLFLDNLRMNGYLNHILGVLAKILWDFLKMEDPRDIGTVTWWLDTIPWGLNRE